MTDQPPLGEVAAELKLDSWEWTTRQPSGEAASAQPILIKLSAMTPKPTQRLRPGRPF